jgi:hypothetical protein
MYLFSIDQETLTGTNTRQENTIPYSLELEGEDIYVTFKNESDHKSYLRKISFSGELAIEDTKEIVQPSFDKITPLEMEVVDNEIVLSSYHFFVTEDCISNAALTRYNSNTLERLDAVQFTCDDEGFAALQINYTLPLENGEYLMIGHTSPDGGSENMVIGYLNSDFGF